MGQSLSFTDCTASSGCPSMTFMDEKNSVVNTGHARTCAGKRIQTTQAMVGEHVSHRQFKFLDAVLGLASLAAIFRRTWSHACQRSSAMQQLALQVLAHVSLWRGMLFETAPAVEMAIWSVWPSASLVAQAMQERGGGRNAPALILLLPSQDQTVRQ